MTENELLQKLNKYLFGTYYCKFSTNEDNVLEVYSKYTDMVVFDICRQIINNKKHYYIRSQRMMIDMQIIAKILEILKGAKVW